MSKKIPSEFRASAFPLALLASCVMLAGTVCANGQTVTNTIPVTSACSAPVPTDCPLLVAVNSATNVIYVASGNSQTNNLSIIDGVLLNGVTNIPLQNTPSAIVVNQLTNQVYVLNYNQVTVLDGSTGILTQIPIATGGTTENVAMGMALNPIANTIYIPVFSSQGSNSLIEIDGATKTVAATFPLPGAPSGQVLVERVGISNVEWVLCESLSGYSSIVEVAGDSSITTIQLPSVQYGRFSMALNPVTSVLYVTDFYDGSVEAIVVPNGITQTLGFGVGFYPESLAVNSANNQVYIASASTSSDSGTSAGTLQIINGATYTETLSKSLNSNLSFGGPSLLINPTNNDVYLANPSGNSVTVINGTTNGLTTLNVGNYPLSQDVNQSTGVVYVANEADGTLSVIAPAATVGPPANIAIKSGNNQTAVVTSQYGQALQVTVTDASGNPVPNANVTFAAPATGASATFGGPVTVTTNTNGVATSPALTANTVAGAFTVTATVTGVTPATFNLTNEPGAPASITPVSGGGQSAVVNAIFTNPLVVAVADAYGNPTPNVTVNFSAPTNSAGATFIANPATATTTAAGRATSPAVQANAIAGSYNVAANIATGTVAPALFPLTNTPGTVATLNIYSGNSQTATVQTAFTNPLAVIAKDVNGNPVPNVTVTFSAPASSGPSGTFAGSASVLTNPSGVATSPFFTANTHAGTYSVTATVASLVPVNFTLTNLPGTAASITATSGSGQSAQVNTAFASPLAATVTDAYGNPIPNSPVNFTAPGSGASGAFTGGAITASVQTNSSGLATSPTFTANSQVGQYSVTASAGSFAPAAFALTNTHGNPSTISITSGNGQSAQVNHTFGSPLVVTVQDASSNPVPNVSVTFAAPSSGASATFAGTTTLLTDSNGRATSSTLTANATAGTYSVTATVGSLAPATFSLTNTSGAPGSITVTSGSNQNAVVNAPFGSPLVATVKDASGNPVPNATVTFTGPSTGASAKFAGSLSALVQTNASGVATSPTFTANTIAGNYSITATVAGAASAVLFAETNSAAAPGSISIASGNTQSAQTKTAFGSPLAVLIRDIYSNPVPNASVTFTAPSSGASGTFTGSAASVTVQTNSSGVATSPVFTANATTGNYSVTAFGGDAGSTLFNLTNLAGSAGSITIYFGNDQSAPAGGLFAKLLEVTVKDTSGNLLANTTVTFTAPSTGASGTFTGGAITATAQTNSLGVATAPAFTANATIGAYSVIASASGATGQATFSLTNLAPLTITTTALANGTAGLAYSATLASQNGTAPYKWAVTTGSLPANLTLNPQTGAITGTPTATGTFPFTVTLTDSSTPTPQTTTQALSLFINPPVTQPVTPTFTLKGLPPTQAPGTTITDATIQLSQPSSIAYTGTLSLSFTPNAQLVPAGYNDSAFVDSSGNKSTTMTLTIPGATTAAALPTIDPGTVAGDILVTLTVPGQTPSTSTVTIEPAAPTIEAGSVAIVNPTATGFDVEFVATSSTREATIATFTFTPKSGYQITGNATISVPVGSLLATQWFSTAQSYPYGGSFTLTIPFTLTAGTADGIQSVSVTLANTINNSNAVSSSN